MLLMTINSTDVSTDVATDVATAVDTIDQIANDLHFLAVKTYVFEIFIVVCIGVLIVIGLCKLFNYVFRSLV